MSANIIENSEKGKASLLNTSNKIETHDEDITTDEEDDEEEELLEDKPP